MEWVWIVGITWFVLMLPLAMATGYWIRRVDATEADRRRTAARPSIRGRRAVWASPLRLLSGSRDDHVARPPHPDSRRGGEPEGSRPPRRRIGRNRVHRHP